MSLAQVRNYDESKWRSLADAAAARFETRLFIDGNYVDSADGGRFETVNPTSGETLAAMSAGTSKDIDLAVASARFAWRKRVFR